MYVCVCVCIRDRYVFVYHLEVACIAGVYCVDESRVVCAVRLIYITIIRAG